MNTIKGRMMIGYGIVILFVVLILGALFIGTVRQYYYGSVNQTLSERAAVSARFFSQYLDEYSLREQSRYIYESAIDDDFTRIEVFDLQGNLVIDSYGLQPHDKILTPDITAALKGSTQTWTGVSPETQEKIYALSQPLMQGNRAIGVIRYTTSIEQVDQVVNQLTMAGIAVGVIVIFLSWLVSTQLAKRIVSPIDELTAAAGHMAGGDFTRKAEKRYDDEVGHLADTLNFMADEIVRNDKLKSDFISSISHELRTPLTSIKGWSETLISGGLDEQEETKLGLKVISKETDRLIGLVEDLLDFSKLQSGNHGLMLETVDLNHLVEEIGQQFAASVRRQHIHIAVEAKEARVEVLADRNRLKQVMVNLLDNAIKFTTEGGTIRLSTGKEEEWAVIKVTDDGAGIAEDSLKRVTDKFYKGDARYPGSGLGLSICKEIVEQHEGKLFIFSKLGVGTTVKVTLPLPSTPPQEI